MKFDLDNSEQGLEELIELDAASKTEGGEEDGNAVDDGKDGDDGTDGPKPVENPDETDDDGLDGDDTPDDTPDNNDDDNPVAEAFKIFKEKTGFEGEFELGDDFTVEDVADLYNKAKEELVSKYSVYEKDEEIKQLAEWKAQGNTLETFKAVPVELNPENFDIENDKAIRDNILKAYFQLKNLDEEEIEDNLALVKTDEDKYKAYSKKALDYLVNKSKEEKEEYLKGIEATREKEKEKQEELTKHLNSGDFGSISLKDKEELKEFKKYLTSETYSSNWDNITPQQELLIEYLLFKNFDIKSLGVKGSTPARQKRQGVSLVSKIDKGSTKKSTVLKTEEALSLLQSLPD